MGRKKQLNIGLIGAGAVGTFYGAHLSKVGAKLSIISRSPNDYDKPIFIESCDEDFEFEPDQIVTLGQPTNTQFDALILSIKVLPTIDAVQLIQPYMSENTVLLMIQNGLFIEDSIKLAFSQPIFRGLAFVCSQRVSKTHIRHLDFGMLTIGQVSGDVSHENISNLKDILSQVDFHVKDAVNIRRAVWDKLIWNAPFNPLSVINGPRSTKDLLNDPATRDNIRGIMQEVIELARVDGHDFDDAIIDFKIEQTEMMAPYFTSMSLDYSAGLPLEIDAILGKTCQFADQNGVEVPLLKQLYQEFHS